MINEENLNKLYSDVVSGVELSTKQMNTYGFNSKDLNDLIKDGSIERVKRGIYSFKSVEELYNYGIELLNKREYYNAHLCFKKCHELDPSHIETCLQLFLLCIEKDEYEDALKMLDILSNTGEKHYVTDSNYYLYLLNVITDIPDKYKQHANHLNFNDIRVSNDDEIYPDIRQENSIRSAVIRRKFCLANKKLNNLVSQNKDVTIQNSISRILLHKVSKVDFKNRITTFNLIQEKKYEEARDFLSNRQESNSLNTFEVYMLELIKQFLEIKESKIIPKIQQMNVETFEDAINARNYDAALKLNIEFNNYYNIDGNLSPLSILLKEICNYIDTIKKLNEKEETEASPIKTISKKEVETHKNIQSVNTPRDSFTKIISFLMKNDVNNALICLKEHMNSMQKSEYEFLIIDLIKLSILEKDITFTKPMLALSLIGKNNYQFDIASYIQEFYIALSKNKFKEARIYLDIISNSNKLGQECIITDGLYQILEISEKDFDYKNNITDNNGQEATLNLNATDSLEVDLEEGLPRQPKDYEIDSLNSCENVNEVSQEKLDSEKAFIKKKHKQLIKKQSIILLKAMDDQKINRLLDIVSEYDDMIAFVIEDETQKRIVLKYKYVSNEKIDVNKLFDLGNKAYKEKRYYDCKNYYLKLLQILDEPKSYVYSKLGYAYMQTYSKYDLLIDYFTVANSLAKKENSDRDYNYTELLLYLKGKIKKEDTKETYSIKFKENDFIKPNNLDEIACFDEINSHIIESGLDVESACNQMNMSLEQTNTIKLIYARKFYEQGDFEKGELFLKSVEQCKGKSESTLELLEEIKKNKKLYLIKNDGNQKTLSLLLKPKK